MLSPFSSWSLSHFQLELLILVSDLNALFVLFPPALLPFPPSFSATEFSSPTHPCFFFLCTPDSLVFSPQRRNSTPFFFFFFFFMRSVLLTTFLNCPPTVIISHFDMATCVDADMKD